MLNIGDVIAIGGREATVCYLTQVNGRNYTCVAFETPELEYAIYDYKYEGEKLLVAKVEDQNEMDQVLPIFIEEGLNEYGLPPELEEVFANLPDDNE